MWWPRLSALPSLSTDDDCGGGCVAHFYPYREQNKDCHLPQILTVSSVLYCPGEKIRTMSPVMFRLLKLLKSVRFCIDPNCCHILDVATDVSEHSQMLGARLPRHRPQPGPVLHCGPVVLLFLFLHIIILRLTILLRVAL